MNELQRIDAALFKALNQDFSHPFLDQVLPVITDLHETALFWVVLLAFFTYWIGKSGKRPAFLIGGAIFAIGFTDASSHWLLKENIQRLRPHKDPAVEAVLRTHPHAGYSLPSNHAANNFCLATYFTVFYPPAAAVLFPVAALISYSRIYVGVHYPFDVLAGGLWGILWALLMAWLVRRYFVPRPGSPH